MEQNEVCPYMMTAEFEKAVEKMAHTQNKEAPPPGDGPRFSRLQDRYDLYREEVHTFSTIASIYGKVKGKKEVLEEAVVEKPVETPVERESKSNWLDFVVWPANVGLLAAVAAGGYAICKPLLSEIFTHPDI